MFLLSKKQTPCNNNQFVEELFQKHYCLVEKYIKKYRHKPTRKHIDGIRSDAEYGLFFAAKSFDPEKGLSFEEFAGFKIVHSIKDGFRQRDHLPQRIRKKGDSQKTFTSIDAIQGDTEPSLHYQDQGLLSFENRDLIAKLLSKLDSDSQELIRLHYFDQLEVKEIAKLKKISVSQIYRRLKNIIKQLREIAIQYE